MTVLERLADLADLTRSRLLLVLDRHELSVGELCAVLQLPQSTVSRHLKILGDQGWVVSRPDGTSRRYRMAPGLDAEPRRLWHVVREQLADTSTASQDAQRTRSVLAERRVRSQEFFATAAGEWDGVRAELFGEGLELTAIPGLLDDQWAVGDLGCGTGQSAARLAPFVRRVIGVDASRAMLSAARRRLAGHGNVELRAGELEALPIHDGELDAALMLLVLHYLSEPEAALVEARRSLRPGGRLLVVDMMPHEREEYRQHMGHVWLGFGPDQLSGWLGGAGFGRVRYRELTPDPRAKGPMLFAATAVALDAGS